MSPADRRMFTRSFQARTAGVVAAGMLAGCAAPITREARIGADDGQDSCRGNVVALDSTGDFFAEDMLQGAVAGALLGGAVGALSAVMSGNDVGKSAAIGAVGGAVAGAGVGYYQHKAQQGRDQAILGIRADLDREIAQLDRANTAMQALYDCRLAQRRKIDEDLAAGRISSDEAQRQWQAWVALVERDKQLAAMVSANLGKRLNEYSGSLDQAAALADPAKSPTPEEQRRAVAEVEKERKKYLAESEKSWKKREQAHKKALPRLSAEEKDLEAKRFEQEKAAKVKKEAAINEAMDRAKARAEKAPDTLDATKGSVSAQVKGAEFNESNERFQSIATNEPPKGGSIKLKSSWWWPWGGEERVVAAWTCAPDRGEAWVGDWRG